MSATEYQELAALWAQEPDAEEQRILHSLARAVSWRAKLLYNIEVGLTVLLVTGVAVALILDKRPATIALVGLIVLAIAWSSWKRHKYHQVVSIADFTDRESLLSSAIKTAEARLRQARLGALTIGPGFFLGLALRGTLDGSFQEFLTSLQTVLLQPLTAIGAFVIALAVLYAIHMIIKTQQELRRLRSLLNEYRDETSHDLNSTSS